VKTVLEVVNLAVEFLSAKGVKNARREVQDLFSQRLGIRPMDLYVQFDRPMQEAELVLFRSDLARRAKGEPYQYICGEVEFFDCRLNVSNKVLIPRQETEILVDKIAQHLAGESLQGKVLWDVCCGSGCIGIAIKKRFPELAVVLSDLSADALAVAARNAEQNDVEVTLRQGDLLQPFAGELADFFVCNPPYISEEEYPALDIEVRGFEPKMALVAKDDGLDFYKRLGLELAAHLQPQGKAWLELGHAQGLDVEKIFKSGLWQQMQLSKDWSGHDRFFFLENE